MIAFRPLARADLPLLKTWLNTAHVYEWWGRQAGSGALGGAGAAAATDEEIEAKYGPNLDHGGPTHRYIVELDGAAIGLIQWYRLRDFADYARAIGENPATTAGVDFLIGEASMLGRGLGANALDLFVRAVVFQAPGIDRVVGGPAEPNARSIRAFEKAGFTRLRSAVVEGELFPAAVMVRRKEP